MTFPWSSGFETGDFAGFDFCAGPINTHINSDPAFVHSGNYSVMIHYNKCATCGSADQNLFVDKHLLTPLEHSFIKGYFYLGDALPGTEAIQRKLFYLKDPKFGTSSGGVANPSWSVVVTSFNYKLTFDAQPPNDTAFKTGDNVPSTGPVLQTKHWYALTLEVQANTPGQRDGYVKLWLDGQLVVNRPNMNLRGNLSTGLNQFGVGYQADNSNQQPVNGMRYDEMRYWDDITVSDQPITP